MIPQIKTILYTTTLSSHTLPVFRFTVGLAKQYGAKIVLLHVVEPLNNTTRFLIESCLPPDLVNHLNHEATRSILEKIHKRLEKFCADELGSTLEEQTAIIAEIRAVSGSSAAETILQEAERCNADLIVVGTHTGSVLQTHLLGSTARRVTLLAKRPVLVVPVTDNPDNEWPESLI
ncbi:MAG: universal stress protein [Candidatus Competibacteraceae bacterium]